MRGYSMGEDREVSDLIGQTLTKIEFSADKDEILFHTSDGKKYRMYHWQDCCEDVSIDDINGNLDDLIGTPIVMAEESTNSDNPKGDYDEHWGTFTWTFYKFATTKGYVTFRWYGESNGYYSESVDFEEIRNK